MRMDENDNRKSDGGGGTSDESNLCKKKKMMMMMVHDHDDHDKLDDCGWRRSGGDVDGGGPTCNNNSRPRTSSSSSSGDVIDGSTVKTLQPFDNIGAEVPQTSFKSRAPGGGLMSATSMGFFPFTNAQWKELERQAMIYKYMMASLPVPHQLLFPFLINPSPPYVGSGLNVIRFSNGGDLEPGRCRRTDGKKWRCSRDVAPDQKYCERHLHRGRHRSRKPVEQLPPKNNKKTRLQSDPPPSSSITRSYNHVKSNEKVTVFESLEQQRCLDNWMTNSSVYNQNYHPEPPLNLNCYTDIINPDLVASLEYQHQTETPGFIDLWSNGVSDHDHNNNTNSGNSSSNGNLLLSPLSLSMGGSSSSNNTTTIDDEMGRIHMGLGVIQTDQDHECSTKLPFTSWLPLSSWAPGGPLAEVLRPSTVIQSNPPSTVATVNGDTLSSPSGVLQKTLASSWSDSSGSSSPTRASSNANNKPVELALLWLNQGKLSSSST